MNDRKKCPECATGYLEKNRGAQGMILACSNYPKCKCIKGIQYSPEYKKKEIKMDPQIEKNTTMHAVQKELWRRYQQQVEDTFKEIHLKHIQAYHRHMKLEDELIGQTFEWEDNAS